MPVKTEERIMERKLKPVEIQGFITWLCCRKKKCVRTKWDCRKQKEINSKRVAGNGVLVGGVKPEKRREKTPWNVWEKKRENDNRNRTFGDKWVYTWIEWYFWEAFLGKLQNAYNPCRIKLCSNFAKYIKSPKTFLGKLFSFLGTDLGVNLGGILCKRKILKEDV